MPVEIIPLKGILHQWETCTGIGLTSLGPSRKPHPTPRFANSVQLMLMPEHSKEDTPPVGGKPDCFKAGLAEEGLSQSKRLHN